MSNNKQTTKKEQYAPETEQLMLEVENTEKVTEKSDLQTESNQKTAQPTNKFTAFFVTVGHGVLKALKTVWRWIKRTFWGASKELVNDDVFAVEKLESPSKMTLKAFFRKKLAVAALVVLIAMFLFVFVGPMFISIDLNATDTTQKNVAPNYSMRSVPRRLKNNIRSISSFGSFTVGVSNDNEMFIWGDAKLRVAQINLKELPEGFDSNKVAFAAAGVDHIIAITTDGKVFGWGSNNSGQYGGEENLGVFPEPKELVEGTIDVSNVSELVCGNQTTAIVMKDGSVYAWGNLNTTRNLSEIAQLTNVEKIVLGNSAAIALLKDGTVNIGSNQQFTLTALEGKKAIDIAASNYALGVVTSDGQVYMSGIFENNEDKVPVLENGDKYVKISAGTKHFAAVTENGVLHCWGSNFYKQTQLDSTTNISDVYAVSLQTYAINDEAQLVKSCGLKGYLMGTDNMGRDMFARIVHGGTMTMTIGAVAVIISTIIAIIVGCVAGYFGGWVDMLLMRISEIFSAIPFLPFAMMLSMVIRSTPLNDNETMRIFIIMCILGVLSWTGLAHMIRGQVLAEREKEFVVAAKAMGVKERRIAFKHILPNVISVILVSLTLDFAGCMLTESSLSYLGFGVQQPQPTWGNMLNGSNNSIVIQNYWWQWLFPSIFLGISTICVNIIGDTLRDIFDPKSNSER